MEKLKTLYNKALNFIKKIDNYLKSENDENTHAIVKHLKTHLAKMFSIALVVSKKIAQYINEALMLDIEEGRNKRIAVLVATFVMVIFLAIQVIMPRENAVAVYVGDELVGITPIAIPMNDFEDELFNKAYDEYGKVIEFENDNITLQEVKEDIENLTTYEKVFDSAYAVLESGISYLGYSAFVNGNEEIMLKSEEEIESVLQSIIDEYKTKNTIESGFVEEVEVKPSTGDLESYMTKDEAYEYLTHSVIKNKEHVVVEGDTLWDIAWFNDITVNELLDMNPSITEDGILKLETVLNLVLPKPFLSAYTIDQVTYDDVAYRGIEVIENDDEYKTYRKTIIEGSDGERTVTDKIEYVNGYETNRETLQEVIHIAPVTKVIEVGTMQALPKKAVGTFKNPVNGRISDVFGSRGGRHYGLDIAAPTGTPVYASDGGKVTKSGWFGGYGNVVIIDHQNGFQTYYAHNSTTHVSVGQMVAQGEIIASVGSTGDSTGPHVHFEIRVNGIPRNPMNYLQ